MTHLPEMLKMQPTMLSIAVERNVQNATYIDKHQLHEIPLRAVSMYTLLMTHLHHLPEKL